MWNPNAGQPGPNPYPPNVGYPGGCHPTHPPSANPPFPPGPLPTPPGVPQGNPAFPPGGPCYPVPQPGHPGCQPSGPYPPAAYGRPPVNPLAPGMVGPGMVMDKKMKKKMKKAHKKKHKHHKHGKVSALWSLARKRCPLRRTRVAGGGKRAFLLLLLFQQ
uniref:Poly(rC) binding protein 2 n=1 Tax=Sus scrofa TaxID=9823 RepID=A0A8D2C399_PIG